MVKLIHHRMKDINLVFLFLLQYYLSQSEATDIYSKQNVSLKSELTAKTSESDPSSDSCLQNLYIPFGSIRYSASINGGDPTVIATLHCLTGYKLNGSSYLICEHPEGWPRPSNLPNCIRNDPNLPCGRPQAPNNSIVILQKKGYFIHYKCRHGYWLQGPAFRECTTSHIWSGIEPLCVAESSAVMFLRSKMDSLIQFTISTAAASLLLSTQQYRDKTYYYIATV